MLVIEYIMCTKYRSHSSYTDTCVPIILYCLGLFVVVYKQKCDRSLRVILTKFHYTVLFRFCVDSEGKDDEEQKFPLLSPYIYDTRYDAHPYKLSTTVLSDYEDMRCIVR